MHDLFQAVLSCHKLFCPLFYFPSFYSCPALIPLLLLLQHPFIAVLLELYLLLSPCPWITVPLTFLSFTFLVPFDGVFYFSPPFVEQAKPSPRHPINPNLLWLAAMLKTDENRALLTTSSLPAFIYLCFFMLFTSFPLSLPLLPSGTSFYLVFTWSAVIFWAPCFAHLPILHQHSLKIKVRD